MSAKSTTFIALLLHTIIYILFRLHLDVQIGLMKYKGQTGSREALLSSEALIPKLRQGVEQSDDGGRVNLVSGDHRNPSYLFMQQLSIRESPSLIMK